MIGIFDSGIGGLGIMRKVKLFLPYEDILYYADNKNAPYGGRDKTEIRNLTIAAITKMEEKGCNIIVLACNTATTAGIDYYRKHINKKTHLIGVVPVIKTAAKMTDNNKIALLATPFTVKTKYVDALIKKFAPQKKVNKIGCTNWVEAIEKNKVTDQVIKNCTKNIKEEDIVVLGCTHFGLIKGHIQRIIGPNKKVISSNDAVARHVMRIGQKYKLLHNKKRKAKYTFLCSGNNKQFIKRVKDFI